MRPLLFYLRNTYAINDPSHQKFLEKLLNTTIDTYPVLDHIEAEYDHNNPPPEMPGTCWCTIPGQDDPIWPKLFMNPEKSDGIDICEKFNWNPVFVAKGADIFTLKVEDIYKEFGTNITPAGDWEI